jgi:hypothetical protein
MNYYLNLLDITSKFEPEMTEKTILLIGLLFLFFVFINTPDKAI